MVNPTELFAATLEIDSNVFIDDIQPVGNLVGGAELVVSFDIICYIRRVSNGVDYSTSLPVTLSSTFPLPVGIFNGANLKFQGEVEFPQAYYEPATEFQVLYTVENFTAISYRYN